MVGVLECFHSTAFAHFPRTWAAGCLHVQIVITANVMRHNSGCCEWRRTNHCCSSVRKRSCVSLSAFYRNILQLHENASGFCF